MFMGLVLLLVAEFVLMRGFGYVKNAVAAALTYMFLKKKDEIIFSVCSLCLVIFLCQYVSLLLIGGSCGPLKVYAALCKKCPTDGHFVLFLIVSSHLDAVMNVLSIYHCVFL